jgi:hypothetical protein
MDAMNELHERFGSQLAVLVIIALISAAAALAVRGQRHWPFGIAPAPACLAAGAAFAIAAATLTREAGARSPGRVQLEPFHSIRGYLSDPSDLAFYLCGNVVLFMPLGFFLCVALRRGLVVPFVLTGLASIGVEILQLPIWSRSSDVDDVLLNTLGGLLGVVTAAVFSAIAGHATDQHSYQSGEPDRPMPTLLPMH